MIGSTHKKNSTATQLELLGLPKQKWDDWKYSDLSRYALDEFLSPKNSAEADSKVTLAKKWSTLLPAFLLPPADALAIIFYNGQLLEIAPELAALNTKLIGSAGAELIIDGKTIEQPIFILHILESNDTPTRVDMQNNIVLTCSSATLIEVFFTMGKENRFAKISNKIQLGEDCQLQHVYCQVSQPSVNTSLLLGQVHIEQAKGSHYTTTMLTKGGSLNRVAVQIAANGTNSETHFYAVQLPVENQQMDLHLTMQHHSPAAQSSIIARTVVNDQARAAFTGKIVVDKGATQTKAALENKNLLLCKTAEMNTRPQLEIYNDDVQCSHGATVGHLDPEAVFYLTSRGIPESEAIEMLVQAFLDPALAGVAKGLQDWVTGVLYAE